jgi:hypothetical protein
MNLVIQDATARLGATTTGKPSERRFLAKD